MRVITHPNLIEKYQNIFKQNLMSVSNQVINCNVGYMGGSLDADVIWLEDYGIWYYPRVLENKYWNAFEISKPNVGKSVSITGEINFPLIGINRSINSVFVESDGKVFIVHRGRMGGGKKGVGQSLFFNNYRGDYCEFNDGEKILTGALVASLFSDDFVAQISRFIKEYNRIKGLTANNTSEPPEDENDDGSFSEEFGGKRRGYTFSEIIEASCNHGIVVNACAEYLKEKGYTVKNDKHRDLVLLDAHQHERIIFEFKTDVSTTSIYCAIGQLLFHKKEQLPHTKYIMVIPDGEVNKIRIRLSKLNIELITYKMNGNIVSFIGLENTLEDIL